MGEFMAELIGGIVALFIVHGIPYLMDQQAKEQNNKNLENEIKRRQDPKNWKY